MEKIYHTNSNHQRTGVAILISDRIDFRTRNITRQIFYNDKSINTSEDLTIINVTYAPNRALEALKE